MIEIKRFIVVSTEIETTLKAGYWSLLLTISELLAECCCIALSCTLAMIPSEISASEIINIPVEEYKVKYLLLDTYHKIFHEIHTHVSY